MAFSAKALVRRLLAGVFHEYRINWIVASSGNPEHLFPADITVRRFECADGDALAGLPDDVFRSGLNYHRHGMDGLALIADRQIAAVAHFASQDLYTFQSIWPLQAGEVALVDIATQNAARGKGYATILICQATRFYTAQGTTRLIAFIWWSNTASRRCFAKAGWRTIAMTFEARCFGRWWSLRIPLVVTG